MRILMLAPQPFMEPRGVPFSVYYHIKALGELGHEVDLITYHVGKTVQLPGLRIYRIPAVPFVRVVKVGPSLAKFPLDLLVFFLAIWRLCLRRYRFLFTHEEAGLMGIVLAFVFGCKHLYCMHSDLAQQTVSSNFTRNPALIWCIERVQRLLVCKSDAVIAICPDIEAAARRLTSTTPVYLVENIAVDEELPPASVQQVVELREQLELAEGPILVYTGTFESYQGLDLLLKSIVQVSQVFPDVCYVLVGGKDEQIRKLRELARALKIEKHVRLLPQHPTEDMPAFMTLADVLLSPRSKGTNTPLKLYTYLRSGKPILATSILSHTQILTSDTAKLVPPTPEGLAQGALELLRDLEQARTLGSYARRYAQEHYSWPVFLKKSQQVYNEFMNLCPLEQPMTIQRQEAGRR